MIKIVRLDSDMIIRIADTCRRDQLQYHEYTFLNKDQLSEYFKTRLKGLFDSPESYLIAAVSGGDIYGILSCTKDFFDSEIFGFSCYKITDLLVFTDEMLMTTRIVSELIKALEKKLHSVSHPYHLSLSLNNNTYSGNSIFNNLVRNNFHYIHTLLTFSNQSSQYVAANDSKNSNLIIRLVRPEDVEQVSALALTSFKFSRFHMDPFLDNGKAGQLLQISARNSISKGLVDIMFVAESDDKIVGYYSAKKKFIPEFGTVIGEAVISAVDADFRGKGVFSKLNASILNWLSDNTGFSEMGTYLANYPVHRTWIKKGLELIRGSHQFSKMNK